jgi:hypothetical protein
MNFTISWPDQSLFAEIHCAPGVLADLEMVAVDGLLAMPRIGLGVGGLLLGTRDNGRIQVLKSLEIPCSHAEGPAFVLTAPEIDAAIAVRHDGTESDTEVVGWYCSKTSGPITMTDHDRDLFEILCPESWQLALLLRPIRGNPTLAAFGVRESAQSGSRIRFGIPQELLPPEPLAESPDQADLVPETANEPAIEPEAPVVRQAIPVDSLELPLNEPVEPRPAQPALPRPVAEPEIRTAERKLGAAHAKDPATPLVQVKMPRSGTIFGAPEPGAELTTAQWWLIFIVALLLIIGVMAFLTRDLWIPRPTRSVNLNHPTSLSRKRDLEVVEFLASRRVFQTRNID